VVSLLYRKELLSAIDAAITKLSIKSEEVDVRATTSRTLATIEHVQIASGCPSSAQHGNQSETIAKLLVSARQFRCTLLFTVC